MVKEITEILNQANATENWSINLIGIKKFKKR